MAGAGPQYHNYNQDYRYQGCPYGMAHVISENPTWHALDTINCIEFNLSIITKHFTDLWYLALNQHPPYL